MADRDTKPLSFKDLNLSPAVAQAVLERGYAEPTAVQAAAFGPAAAGHDLVVQARTGTGKTAAFGMPLVSARVRYEPVAVQALILCPTRELALQVTQEIEALSRHTQLRVASVYGGASITKQVEELTRGAHIVVGTPGRVLDHLKRKTLRVDELRSFVLDECDEMLSMGFLPQINDIWIQLPSGHQTLLFSATVPKEVTRIAETRLRNPEFITLSGDHIGALEIQHFVYLSHGDKLSELLQIIEVENPESAIVFCNTRDETKRVAQQLQALGFEADWLNADLSQSEREQVMKRIRENALRFLVCTDVAARGIDISHLTHVINFDFPEASEQYVHRTGRTGRAGRIGTAISLINPGAIGDLYYLRLKYKIHPHERHLPTRQELRTRQEADVIASLSLKFTGLNPGDRHFQLARRLLASDDAEQVIAGLLREHLGPADTAIDNAGATRRAALPSSTRTTPKAASAEPAPAVATPSVASDTRPGPARARDATGGHFARSGARPSRDGERPRADTRVQRAAGERPLPAGEERAPGLRGERPRRLRPRREQGDIPFRYEVSDAPADAASLTSTGANGDAVNSEPNLVADSSSGARANHEPAVNGNAVLPSAAGAQPSAPARELPRAEDDGTADAAEQYVSLFFGVGRRDGANRHELQEVLDRVGVAQTETGRILVKQHHSFIEVSPRVQQRVIETLNGSTICGRQALVEVARSREPNV